MKKTNDMYARQWWSGSFPAGILALLFLCAGVIPAAAAPVSNVVATKHNLSKTNAIIGAVKTSASSTNQDQVCVFCHTPHAATANVSPLWNKSVNAASAYTGYTSLSMDADSGAFKANTNTGRPAGGSLLCLSCHDGTLALGTVGVLNAQTNVTISLDNSNAGKMPTGSGTNTGFTRVIGQDLSNDHPISVTYNDVLATADGELRHMNASQVYSYVDGASNTVNVVGLRTRTMKPQFPLLPTGTSGAGQIQCPTCHDPHLYDSADLNRKFLRGNRLQAVLPTGGNYNKDNDIICLACHDKMGTEWSNSIHAVSTVAYTDTAATLREFPTGTQVWKAACLNCHDTHTVSGARRLLREGTDSTASPKAGGNSAIEEACYQCHTAATASPANTQASALTLPTVTATAGVPNIKTEFLRTIRMPITSKDQGGGSATNTIEVHDISNADFIESDVKLGKGNTVNRHVECTDCHNPHRVIKNERYDGTGVNGYRTHVPGGTKGSWAEATDGNVASGVLRGMWGVEAVVSSVSTSDWPVTPTYDVKSGVPGVATAPLTKEYQLCFKCHSNYANTTGAFPSLRGNTYGGTASNTNGLTKYTNVAAEFSSVVAWDPPQGNGDQGEKGDHNNLAGGTNIDPIGSYPGDAGHSTMTDEDTTTVTNHRSWHPVMWPTGRSVDERRILAATANINFKAPFNSRIGTQTMYCSDCHGSDVAWAATTGADRTQVQGPHGSANNFLLKGVWSTAAAVGSPAFCGNCHNPTAGPSCSSTRDCFGDGNTTSGTYAQTSGFNNPGTSSQGGHGNMHASKPCMRCHVAVPHGWKNKAFLVNLNCVGAEVAGKAAKTCDPVSGYANYVNAGNATYSAEPYYVGAFLRVRIWKPSGNWQETSCGANGADKPSGNAWMNNGGGCGN